MQLLSSSSVEAYESIRNNDRDEDIIMYETNFKGMWKFVENDELTDCNGEKVFLKKYKCSRCGTEIWINKLALDSGVNIVDLVRCGECKASKRMLSYLETHPASCHSDANIIADTIMNTHYDDWIVLEELTEFRNTYNRVQKFRIKCRHCDYTTIVSYQPLLKKSLYKHVCFVPDTSIPNDPDSNIVIRTMSTPDGCEIPMLKAKKNKHGVSFIWNDLTGKPVYLDTLMYRRANPSVLTEDGSLPSDKLIWHTCNCRSCVNPKHMELISKKEFHKRIELYNKQRKENEKGIS